MKEQYYTIVKFNSSNKKYYFSCNNIDVKYNDKVFVETAKGFSIGIAVTNKLLMTKNILSKDIKPIIRLATPKDLKIEQDIINNSKEALKICEEQINKLNLQMNLISAEYSFDSSKLTIVYIADERVDFRELLKVLASIFRCRIELKQIGSREKSKLIGGIGTCGRELCCKSFINTFDLISINMAKNQMLALNIQKLSGQCGKLMCCLKYENDTYTCKKKNLPKINSEVIYDGQKYKLVSYNIINNQCKLENENQTISTDLKNLSPNKEIIKNVKPKKLPQQ